LSRICVGGIVGALIARIVAEGYGVSSYTFTLCRLDSLTTGGLLALWVRGPSRIVDARRSALAILLGVPLAAAPLYLLNSGGGAHWAQVVKYTLYAAFFGALLILAVASSDQSAIGRVLNWGPLRTVGKYSYGIYVYQAFVIHVSVSMLTTDRLAVLGISEAGAVWTRVMTILLGSYLAAWLSWHLMEKHFIRLKKHFGGADRSAAGPIPSRPTPGPVRGPARGSVRAASV
jgi:peptidoglycan/LPS O-acetylase OafA/YrhL